MWVSSRRLRQSANSCEARAILLYTGEPILNSVRGLQIFSPCTSLLVLGRRVGDHGGIWVRTEGYLVLPDGGRVVFIIVKVIS